MGRLFVVATPIGNLEDMSPRALRVLREVALIAAEDTRVARVLLERYGIKQTLVSYTEHNRRRRIPWLIEQMSTAEVALVTDAGTPAVSDPGAELVQAARAAGHEVLSVPGPSAPVAAVSVSGLRAGEFRFVGFLPRTEAGLRHLLEDASPRSEALVAFESPGRMRRSLALIDGLLPSRQLAVCRELTKLHEETFAGTAAEALAYFAAPRGEFVIVIEGSPSTGALEQPERELHDEVREMKRLGLTRAQATTLLQSRHKLSRRQAYELWLRESADR